MKAKNLILAPMLALTLSATAERHEPLNTTRVMWDISSRQCIFDMGNYGRIIPLNDGRLLAVAETYGTYSGITIAYSNDNGKSWVDKETVGFNGNGVPMAVPDVIQLSDGTIVVGFNPRPSTPYSEDRHFGIECVRSEDNGKTWSEHITVWLLKAAGSPPSSSFPQANFTVISLTNFPIRVTTPTRKSRSAARSTKASPGVSRSVCAIVRARATVCRCQSLPTTTRLW